MSKELMRGPWAPAVIALVAFVRVAIGHPNAPPPVRVDEPVEPASPPTYSDEARALLPNLDVGDRLEGGWLVTELYGPHEGRIVIALVLEEVPMEVSIQRRGSTEARGPTTDHRFDIFFSHPPDVVPPGPAVLAVIDEIGFRLVDDAPIPSGM